MAVRSSQLMPTPHSRPDRGAARTGKSALEDILPVLCPAAMNHATTLRIMERLIADEYRYEVNLGGPLPLGPALRSLTWKRRVYRRSADGEASQARGSANNISQHPS